MDNCCEGTLVNTYDNIDTFGYRILEYLMTNNEDLWKLLKYDVPDALNKPNLTMREKAALIYDENSEDSSDFRVFRSAYMDDIQDEQVSQLRVFLEAITPDNHLIGTVDMNIEVITHIKLINLIAYKNRIEVMLKEVLRTLNGAEIGGVGKLMFDRQMSFYDLVKLNLFNNRNFYGYTIIMSVKASSLGGECE